MNIVLHKAKNFYKYNLVDSKTFDDVLAKTLNEIDSFFEITDKVTFLKYLIEMHSEERKDHEKFCKEKPEECDYSITLRYYVFALENEIKKLISDTDKFNDKELSEINAKLDKVLNDLNILKNGHEIIHDDFFKEIEDLRNSVNLGKKSWRQLLLGKLFEMTASGVISGTVSNGIIKEFQSMYKHLDFANLIN